MYVIWLVSSTVILTNKIFFILRVEIGIIWTLYLWCINSETIWRKCRHCLEIGSDHNVLVANICPRLKKITRFQKGKARWNMEKLYAQWEKVQDIIEQCFPNIFARGPLQIITANSHILAHVIIVPVIRIRNYKFISRNWFYIAANTYQ